MSPLRLGLDAAPWEWALAAAAAAAGLALWPALRALPRGARALRLAALALLGTQALKPGVELLEARYTRPRLAVLVDAGPSMAAADDRGEPRLSRATRWLLRRRQDLEGRADVTLYAAADGLRRVGWGDLGTLKPAPAALDAASALADLAAAGPPPARVWLLSDGAFGGEPGDAGASLDEAVRRLGSPVDSLGVGPKVVQRGVAVASLSSPDFVFLHSRFPVVAALEATQLAGGRLKATLWSGSVKLQELSLDVARPFELLQATFTVEAAGLGGQAHRITVEAYPAGGGGAPSGSGRRAAPGKAEGHAAAAAREFRVEVIRQKHRIMYLAGRPSFEYSHLRAQLKEDPNHELVSFVILRNPENVSPVPDNELSLIPFPASEIFVQNLNQFDLFILENFAYWRFNLPVAYLDNLRRFVASGGALLVIGGSSAFTQGGYHGTPLEETLPVTLRPESNDFSAGLFSPELSSPGHPLLQLGETAEASAELWKVLPPLDGWTRFASVRPGASVLLKHPAERASTGQPLPVLAVREFGRGKVMVLGTGSTWRWKLGGGRDWRLASFYGRFWSRAVQYLTGSLELRKVKFAPVAERLPGREPLTLSLRVFDEHFRPLSGPELDLRIAWTQPGGKQRSLAPFEHEPGVFHVELTDLAEGRHQLKAVARHRGQLWGEDSVEFRWEAPRGDAPLNRKSLQALADRSGGRYADLDAAESEALLAALPPVRPERSVLERRALWAEPGWLVLLVVLLCAEWYWRRRLGLA